MTSSLNNNESTATQAVRDVLTSSRFYLDVLQSGIGNLTAMAERIKPEVEKKAASQVSTNTVVAALKRLADRLPKQEGTKYSIEGSSHGIRLSLTDSITEIALDENELHNLSAIFDKLSDRKNLTFYIFQTSKHCRLFTENVQLFAELERKFSRQ